jgi:hypothetical protein
MQTIAVRQQTGHSNKPGSARRRSAVPALVGSEGDCFNVVPKLRGKAEEQFAVVGHLNAENRLDFPRRQLGNKRDQPRMDALVENTVGKGALHCACAMLPQHASAAAVLRQYRVTPLEKRCVYKSCWLSLHSFFTQEAMAHCHAAAGRRGARGGLQWGMM